MRNILNVIEKNRNTNKKIIIVLICLSILIELVVANLLIRPAYSLVDNADCGFIEHTHVSECYSEHKKSGESVLACSSDLLKGKISHIHDKFCYNEKGRIICPLPENQHIHTDECSDENGVQTCEISYHQHGEECFRILGENDSAQVLECGIEYHTHSENCYMIISSVSSDEVQEDLEETYEPEAEMYENSYDISEQNIDIDATKGFEITEEHIESIVLEYKKDKNDNWKVITSGMENITANSSMCVKVAYKINKDYITSHNNQIVYKGIPSWLNPKQTAEVRDENDSERIIATLAVANGNAVVTFTQEYLDSLVNNDKDKTEVKGTFYVEGNVDWEKIDDPSNPDKLPLLDLNFKFEDDLSAKYGKFKVEKSYDNDLIEIRDSNGKITNTYIKYELKVTSESSKAIPKICITDVLSTENRFNISDVIKGSGYVGVNSTNLTLADSASNCNPYETVTGVEKYDKGTVVLDDNNHMKWEIESLNPNEVRTLVYYVELNEKYVGSGSAGKLGNEAQPESNGFKKEIVSTEFRPTADVDINKTQGTANIDQFGDGTVDYTIVVTAHSDNSYTITDASIKDSFRDGMEKYVDTAEKITVTVTTEGKSQTMNNISIRKDGFNIPIPELKKGQKVEVTYSVPLKNIYASNNGNFNFSNFASFVGDESGGKLKNGFNFKGSKATTQITHNEWSRKFNGVYVDKAKNIEFSTNDGVYDYAGVKQDDVNGFTVPQNAQEYIVIVNEDGIWNMSNSRFKDTFGDDRIAYRGYLRIEEFDKIEEIGEKNILRNDEINSILNTHSHKTTWIDIDGKNDFEIVPKEYGLDKTNKVYRLTYYASVNPNQTSIKNIFINNTFSIEGTIGIGDRYIALSGIKTVVGTTLVGSASYDFEKESLFYEKTSGNGEIYWAIRVNGKLTKNLHIQDRPSDCSINSDSLVGVYFAKKGYDFSEITSYEELENVLSDMETVNGGTSKYFYNLESISSFNDLVTKEFAIFSPGQNNSGYLTSFRNGNTLAGEPLSSHINNVNDNVTTNNEVQMWRFERDEGTTENNRFYIYYTDSSNNKHYMHITNEDIATNEKGVIISTDKPSTSFEIEIKDNKIKIANLTVGKALNWKGDNGVHRQYVGWNNVDNTNNWHYLGTPDDTPKYDYKPQKITDVNDLVGDGKQFAIITPGKNHSGLLIGENLGDDSLTAEMYGTHFDNPPSDIIRSSQLKKWTFEKIDGTDDKFYVYYVDGNNENHYLTLGNNKATTTTQPYAIQINCDNNGRIKLKDTQHDGHTLNWYGGTDGAIKYSSWTEENGNNDYHYVATEEIISQGSSSDHVYNWSFSNSYGNIKILSDMEIPQDKSMYVILRTKLNSALPERDSKVFDNEVGIMDDTSGSFDKLGGASYIYKPNLPVYKEGKVAAYYDGTNWSPRSAYLENVRSDKIQYSDDETFFQHYFQPNVIAKNGAGLYVEWLVNVNWDGTLEGDAVLTDYLNHKMEPVRVRKFNGINPVYFELPEMEKSSDWTKSQTDDVPFYYNKQTGELKIGVGGLHKANTTNAAVVNLQIICRVTDPDVLFNAEVSELTNIAEVSTTNGIVLGKNEAVHQINPHYYITKEGNGIGDNGEGQHGTNKMKYTIDINPHAEDLVYGDTLPVLIDEMSNNMKLEGTVSVCEKKDGSETKLDNIHYSVTEDDNNKKIQIKFDNLPDNKHLIISYKTAVDVKPNMSASVSNIAYWEGRKGKESPNVTETFKYNLGGTASAISKTEPVIVVNKLDLYNNSTLSGATFEIRKVNQNGNIDDSDVITVKTDNDGKIRFANGEQNTLHCNQVYQLKEVNPPTDYVLDSTPKYFMVINPKNNHGYTIEDDKIDIGGEKTDIIISYISSDDTDLEVTVYNKKASVRIKKQFLDESGNEKNGFYGTYRFGLYDSNPIDSDKEPVQILSITYNDDDTISYALDGKKTDEPEFTKARTNVTHFIYELDEEDNPINNDSRAYLNGYSFDVEYSKNSVYVGANGVTVTVKNKYHPVYLPMTGGIGLKKYYSTAFGLLMILSALALITLKLRKKCR